MVLPAGQFHRVFKCVLLGLNRCLYGRHVQPVTYYQEADIPVTGLAQLCNTANDFRKPSERFHTTNVANHKSIFTDTVACPYIIHVSRVYTTDVHTILVNKYFVCRDTSFDQVSLQV